MELWKIISETVELCFRLSAFNWLFRFWRCSSSLFVVCISRGDSPIMHFDPRLLRSISSPDGRKLKKSNFSDFWLDLLHDVSSGLKIKRDWNKWKLKPNLLVSWPPPFPSPSFRDSWSTCRLNALPSLCFQAEGALRETDVSSPRRLRPQGRGAALEEGLLRGHPGHQDQQEGVELRRRSLCCLLLFHDFPKTVKLSHETNI